jgi:hypothetical protein
MKVLALMPLVLALLMIPLKGYNQNIDLILVIDKEIVLDFSVTKTQLNLSYSNGQKSILPLSYFPGNLSMGTDVLNEIKSEKIDSIFFEFSYYEYKGENQLIYNYSIKMEKSWLQDKYLVLNIYNLDKKKFKRRFNFIKGVSYVYELDSPCCTFRLVPR